ncbi:MAG: hypothetical protein LIP01_01315 [Tannerellaceae bacterium]|nr:hypothetical protein [Tannerellaceae bacterium]
MDFVVPKDINPRFQHISIEQLGKQFNELPVWLQETVKEVQLLDYRNPQDEYWEKTYGIKNFTSFATGGTGTITFYKNRKKISDSYLLEVLAHESGHNLDRNLGRVSNTKKWKDAATKDYKVSGDAYVSSYATRAKSYVEDFADSISGYCTDTEFFKKTYPNRSKIIEEIVRNQEKQKSR